MTSRSSLLVLATLLIGGCTVEGEAEHKITPAVASADTVTTADPGEVNIRRYGWGVQRTKVGNCWYVVAYGGTGVAITHAADCPNHPKATSP